MTTPAYSLTASQTVAPGLSLDFTQASLDARITFARALNTATRINSSGTVVSVNADTPRFDYDPVTLAIKGLLIEESRQNLCVYSSAVATSPWATAQIGTATIAVTGNYGVAPDGTTTATRVQFNMNGGTTSGNYAFFYQQLTGATIGTSYYDSIWLKTNNGSTVTLVMRDDITGRYNQLITVTGVWQRFSLGGNATGTNPHICKIWIRKFVGTSDAADILAWGGQCEVGSFSTSYIPTDASAKTRNADVATMTSTNFSNWYNATKGTFRVDAISRAAGTRPIISADDNSANNSIVVKTEGTTSTFTVTQNGNEQANVVAGTITANSDMYTYVSYDANYFGAAKESSRQVDTSGTVPIVDRLRIGASQAGSYFNGHIKKIKFWK